MKALATIRETDNAAAANDRQARTDGERARVLAERLLASGQRSTADILHELRQAFPHLPLSARIAALKVLRDVR